MQVQVIYSTDNEFALFGLSFEDVQQVCQHNLRTLSKPAYLMYHLATQDRVT